MKLILLKNYTLPYVPFVAFLVLTSRTNSFQRIVLLRSKLTNHWEKCSEKRSLSKILWQIDCHRARIPFGANMTFPSWYNLWKSPVLGDGLSRTAPALQWETCGYPDKVSIVSFIKVCPTNAALCWNASSHGTFCMTSGMHVQDFCAYLSAYDDQKMTGPWTWNTTR